MSPVARYHRSCDFHEAKCILEVGVQNEDVVKAMGLLKYAERVFFGPIHLSVDIGDSLSPISASVFTVLFYSHRLVRPHFINQIA